MVDWTVLRVPVCEIVSETAKAHVLVQHQYTSKFILGLSDSTTYFSFTVVWRVVKGIIENLIHAAAIQTLCESLQQRRQLHHE